MTPHQQLGANIRAERQRSQFTHEQISKQSNVPVVIQKQYEAGKIEIPFEAELAALAACFGCSVLNLMRGVE